MEINVTGLNEITSPNLRIWTWEVAMYLFLGGLSAGIMVMSSLANLRRWPDEVKLESGEFMPHCIRGSLIAPFILAFGMFFIFLDLARKLNVYWFYLSFQPLSPMSWGSWAIQFILPLSFLYGLSTVPEGYKHWLVFEPLKKISDRLNPHMKKLAVMNFILGVFLGVYTGVLLSSFLARPLWNSSLLPVLFFTSAASTGAAFLISIARKNHLKLFYTKVDVWLILLEIFVLILFFYGQFTSTAAHRDAIMPFFTFTHEYFPYWISIFLMAILFPLALVIKTLEIREDHAEELAPEVVIKMNLSAGMVLLGGLIIRLAFVYAGQLSRLV